MQYNPRVFCVDWTAGTTLLNPRWIVAGSSWDARDLILTSLKFFFLMYNKLFCFVLLQRIAVDEDTPPHRFQL